MDRPLPEIMWLTMAFISAMRSTCQQKQVGCVITDSAMIHNLAMGYNGNYAGGPNECDFPDATGQARCGCVHSEINAVAKLSPQCDMVAFTSVVPCSACLKTLYNAGVRRVVTVVPKDDEYCKEKPYRRSSIKLMAEMGISLEIIKVELIQDLLSNINKDLSLLKTK